MDKIKKTLQLFKDSWKGFSKKQRYQMIGVFALIATLPIILGGVYMVKLFGSKASVPGTYQKTYTEAQPICQLTGLNNSNVVNVKGTDLGIPMWHNNHLYFFFGDTNTQQASPTSNLSNLLASTLTTDFNNCPALEYITTNQSNIAKEVIPSRTSPEEITLIPTGGISINQTIYVYYMSINQWLEPGNWKTNSSGIAVSNDNGNTFTRIDNMFPPQSNFAQVFPFTYDSQPDYVFFLGIPNGRFGPVKLGRVLKSRITDKSQYQLCQLINPFACQWVANEIDASQIIPAPAGEISIAFSPYLNKWLASYLNHSKQQIEIRTASYPWGPWSSSVTSLDCAAKSMLCYGGFINSQFQSLNKQTLYLNVSDWNKYNVFLYRYDLNNLLPEISPSASPRITLAPTVAPTPILTPKPTPTIRPTPTPRPTIKPTPTPIPTGCYYRHVECFKAPCPPILVCPTPTIRPTPRPTIRPTPTPTPRPCRLKIFGMCLIR